MTPPAYFRTASKFLTFPVCRCPQRTEPTSTAAATSPMLMCNPQCTGVSVVFINSYHDSKVRSLLYFTIYIAMQCIKEHSILAIWILNLNSSCNVPAAAMCNLHCTDVSVDCAQSYHDPKVLLLFYFPLYIGNHIILAIWILTSGHLVRYPTS